MTPASTPSTNTAGNWLSGILIVALLIGAIVMGVEEMHTNSGLPDQGEAPAFSLERFGGGRFESAQLKGRVVMLDFWATWCPPCIEEMPWLVTVAQEYESKGVSFVAASEDDEDEAKAAVGIFIADKVPGLQPYAAFGDDPTRRGFKIRALPTLYVLDRQGKIVGSHTGLASERSVRNLLDEALRRKP